MHKQLESFIWQMPGFFMLKSTDSQVLSANERATKLVGYSSLDAIVGTYDYDSPCRDVEINASKFREEDKLVSSTGRSLDVLLFY